ncbi:MAG: DNA primase [Phenylobacterium sp.]|uniref:DNA primase n=1 Tax=Phenylobacterium sp. TaxID=1871053 RepID=UPI0025E6DDBF|nr:DNA primase [Phenylobacterium sp.]MCA6252446.1 DNA primase [Phenylobacterium sp.]MCA6307473.1 DNA primase [Phenylobacterium sp.]
MRFDEAFLDEIKSRLRPSDVIGRTVKLQKRGREFVGLSPFTKEKTPSFYVNDEKGQFFDFSSGKTGDLIAFLQESERLSFVEAVERLAAEAGLALPAPDPRAAEQEKKRQGLTDWTELAAQWFSRMLNGPPGAAARAYLERRGLPASDWERFRLGFAPASRTSLKDYLVTKGARPADLVEAGLLIAPEDGGAPYDRFRDRIMFPIADGRGRIVSFGGRAMDPEARAKYLNGPETELFHKGRVLYGLPEARRLLAAAAPDAAPPLVVVEGYMDVIACQRAGIAAVAPLGTALTEEQMELLWRRHPEPTLCFDGDRAGRQAAFRALDRALPLLTPGRSFRFSVVEGGKDPDDVLREQGAAALRSQLSRTVGFAETLFRRELESEPLDTPERRAGLKARLRAAASRIADRDLQAAYRDDLLARFEAALPARAPSGPGSDFRGRGAGRGRSWIDPAPTSLGRSAARRLAAALDGPAAALMKHALADPACLDDHLESPFAAGGFGEPDLAGLAKEIIRLRLESEHLDSQGLARHLASIDFEVLLTDIDRAAAKSGAPFLKPDVSLEDARSQWSQAFARLSRLAALDEALSTAKGDLGGSLSMDAFSRLKGERDRLRRQIRNWQDEP